MNNFFLQVQRNEFTFQCCPDQPFSNIEFRVQLRRRHTFYIMNVILPGVMTSAVLLSIFFCTPAQKVHIGKITQSFYDISNQWGSVIKLPRVKFSSINVFISFKQFWVLTRYRDSGSLSKGESFSFVGKQWPQILNYIYASLVCLDMGQAVHNSSAERTCILCKFVL